MGKNVVDAAEKRHGWRENTIRSFLEAAEQGASFIEFDVQVTKDAVPVIWHDDCITYGPNRRSARIRELTFDEFRSIGHHTVKGALLPRETLYRASESATHEWKCETEDALPSLEDVFRQMPSHVDFNIEIKMQSEAQTSEQELAFITAAILGVVDHFVGQRAIVFSSFDPDVVHRLKRERHCHATMFLSEGSGEPCRDPRRATLAAALEWACRSGLDGIVFDSKALRHQPEVIQAACALGLMVMTYGTENDDHRWIWSQFQLGVHGAIVDDVATIAQGLRAAIAGTDSSFH